MKDNPNLDKYIKSDLPSLIRAKKTNQYSLLIDGIRVARSGAVSIMKLANQIRDKYPTTNLQIINN